MRLIISFKEEPNEKTHQKLIAAGTVQCGHSYSAIGQINDLLSIVAIAENEPDHSIALEGGDYRETKETSSQP